MNYVYIGCAALLAVAVTLTGYRLLRGPNTLDRVVAMDALVGIAMGGLGAWAAYSGDSSVLPGVVALSLVGFIGSTSVARFRVPDDALAERSSPTGSSATGWSAAGSPATGSSAENGGRR